MPASSRGIPEKLGAAPWTIEKHSSRSSSAPAGTIPALPLSRAPPPAHSGYRPPNNSQVVYYTAPHTASIIANIPPGMFGIASSTASGFKPSVDGSTSSRLSARKDHGEGNRASCAALKMEPSEKATRLVVNGDKSERRAEVEARQSIETLRMVAGMPQPLSAASKLVTQSVRSSTAAASLPNGSQSSRPTSATIAIPLVSVADHESGTRYRSAGSRTGEDCVCSKVGAIVKPSQLLVASSPVRMSSHMNTGCYSDHVYQVLRGIDGRNGIQQDVRTKSQMSSSLALESLKTDNARQTDLRTPTADLAAAVGVTSSGHPASVITSSAGHRLAGVRPLVVSQHQARTQTEWDTFASAGGVASIEHRTSFGQHSAAEKSASHAAAGLLAAYAAPPSNFVTSSGKSATAGVRPASTGPPCGPMLSSHAVAGARSASVGLQSVAMLPGNTRTNVRPSSVGPPSGVTVRGNAATKVHPSSIVPSSFATLSGHAVAGLCPTSIGQPSFVTSLGLASTGARSASIGLPCIGRMPFGHTSADARPASVGPPSVTASLHVAVAGARPASVGPPTVVTSLGRALIGARSASVGLPLIETARTQAKTGVVPSSCLVSSHRISTGDFSNQTSLSNGGMSDSQPIRTSRLSHLYSASGLSVPDLRNDSVGTGEANCFHSFSSNAAMNNGATASEVVAVHPFNQRLKTLANFPALSQLSSARLRSLTAHRSRTGCVVGTAKSLDLLRSSLQKLINNELNTIIQKYASSFFHPALENAFANSGEGKGDTLASASAKELVLSVCRQMLDEAKKLYLPASAGRGRSVTPDVGGSDGASDAGSGVADRRPIRLPFSHLKRRRSDSDSDAVSAGAPAAAAVVKKKRKGRPPGVSSSVLPVRVDPVKHDDAKWDPARIKPDQLFVMGANANKALGLGATRGRLYIKHPDVFKYTGDQDDKQWLFECHRLPATGGKAYMLLVEDVHELAESAEYRQSSGLMLHELKGFTVPDWMLVKVKAQMAALQASDRVRGKSLAVSDTVLPTVTGNTISWTSSHAVGADARSTIASGGSSEVQQASPAAMSEAPEDEDDDAASLLAGGEASASSYGETDRNAVSGTYEEDLDDGDDDEVNGPPPLSAPFSIS